LIAGREAPPSRELLCAAFSALCREAAKPAALSVLFIDSAHGWWKNAAIEPKEGARAMNWQGSRPYRSKARYQAVIAAAGILSAVSILGAQSGSDAKARIPAKSSSYHAPRTPWGDPDLQGLWPSVDMQGTPYERPADLAGRDTVNDDEFTARQTQKKRQDEADAQKYVTNSGRRGIGAPSHWGEHGTPSHQASLIVEPADGRLPPKTQEGLRREATAHSTYYYDFPDEVVAHTFDNFEDLGPYDRCITRGVLSSMLPTAYNMGTEIFQIPGYVVIRNEMIHETRSIPLDGRPHLGSKIRQYLGDSRGHWEGDTLVIETTNFNAKVGLTKNGNTNMTSQDFKLTERLTRIDSDTIQYEATVDDPRTWTRPWKVSLPFKRHSEYGMFEYACHEGNYGMKNILSGERALEEQAAGNAGTR
jgi:hypothetical protein